MHICSFHTYMFLSYIYVPFIHICSFHTYIFHSYIYVPFIRICSFHTYMFFSYVHVLFIHICLHVLFIYIYVPSSPKKHVPFDLISYMHSLSLLHWQFPNLFPKLEARARTSLFTETSLKHGQRDLERLLRDLKASENIKAHGIGCT